MRPVVAILASSLLLTPLFGAVVTTPAQAAPTKGSKGGRKSAVDRAAEEKAAKEAEEKAEAERLEAEKAAKDKEEREAKEREKAEEAKAKEEQAKRRKASSAKAKAAASDLWNTREKEGKSYLALGFRFRDHVIPQGLINAFVDGGAGVNAPGYGLEFSKRKDGLEVVIGASWVDYAAAPMLFKSKGQPDEAYELITSDLSMLMATFDLLYGIPLDDKDRFTLLLGGGVGLGGVMGDLGLNQVAPNTAGGFNAIDPNNPSSARLCTAAERGLATGPVTASNMLYCDASNDHYGSYKEPGWFGGGMLPSVFPWLSIPQVGLRIKPMRDLQLRLDGGLSTSGLFAGGALSYILPVAGNDPDAPKGRSGRGRRGSEGGDEGRDEGDDSSDGESSSGSSPSDSDPSEE